MHFFDGRIDMTKTMLCKEGSGKSYQAAIIEEHYTACSEPGGIYLFHFTLNKTTYGKKCAEIIANNLYEPLIERVIDQTLLAVGCDSTNVNTGGLGGCHSFFGGKILWQAELLCLCPAHQRVTSLTSHHYFRWKNFNGTNQQTA